MKTAIRAMPMVDALLPAHGSILRRLLEATAQHGGVPVHRLFAPVRDERAVRARWAFMLVAREQLQLSYQRIGQALGGLDHSTVMHGVARAADLNESCADFSKTIIRIRLSLRDIMRLPCRAMVPGDIGVAAELQP